MTPGFSLWRRLRAVFRKEKIDAEMSEEMQAHLEMEAEANVKRGMSPEDSRYAARSRFGGVDQIKDQAREQRPACGSSNGPGLALRVAARSRARRRAAKVDPLVARRAE